MESGRRGGMPPWVKMTGCRPKFKKKYTLGFGGFCEVFDPKVNSRDPQRAKSESCIALCPTGNANGSWKFFNLATKRRVIRTNWKKVVTSEMVINVMNRLVINPSMESKSVEVMPNAKEEKERQVNIDETQLKSEQDKIETTETAFGNPEDKLNRNEINSGMNMNVFMLIPTLIAKYYTELSSDSRQYLQKDGSLLVRLKKALYGCKQSARLWNERLTEFLKQIGFVQNQKDPCVFSKLIDNVPITLGFHVDDGIIIRRSKSNISWFKVQMRKECGDISVHAEDDFEILGMRMQRNMDGSLEVLMEDKIEGVLETIERVVATHDFLEIDERSQFQ